jgi:hypothetical protein
MQMKLGARVPPFAVEGAAVAVPANDVVDAFLNFENARQL